MTGSKQPYSKPPIVEAVIAFTFGEPADNAALSKAADKLKRRYPLAQQQELTTFEMTASGPSIRTAPAGYRLSDFDNHHILILSSIEMVTSVLAPYPGWEELSARAMENYSTLRTVVKYKRITRFAARFINRIDIPLQGRTAFDIQDYVLVAPAVPEGEFFGHLRPYFMRFEADVPGGFKVIVTTGTAPAPILDHSSILLDLDVISFDPPQKESELVTFADTIRKVKNEAFEMCVTNKARELFNS